MATPGFNSLTSAPSVPSLVGTEPVEFLGRVSNISATDPLCFVKQKQKTVEVFLLFLFTNIPSSVQRTQNEIHSNKGCHAVLTTIKQGNQHAVVNRNPKHNQTKTTIYFSFRHVYVLTKSIPACRSQGVWDEE